MPLGKHTDNYLACGFDLCLLTQVQLTVAWRNGFCPLSGVQRLSESRRLNVLVLW